MISSLGQLLCTYQSDLFWGLVCVKFLTSEFDYANQMVKFCLGVPTSVDPVWTYPLRSQTDVNWRFIWHEMGIKRCKWNSRLPHHLLPTPFLQMCFNKMYKKKLCKWCEVVEILDLASQSCIVCVVRKKKPTLWASYSSRIHHELPP